MHHRKERLESLIADLLSAEIVKNLETPDALITITGVEINEEAETATVLISVFPDERKKDVIKGLKKIIPALSFTLLKKMRIKKVPTLLFR